MPSLFLSSSSSQCCTFNNNSKIIINHKIKHGGKFLIFAATHQFTTSFSVSNFIHKYGLSSLDNHHHSHAPSTFNQEQQQKRPNSDTHFDENTTGLRIQRYVDKIRVLRATSKTPQILHTIVKDDSIGDVSDFNDLLMALFISNEIEIAFNLFNDSSSRYNVSPDCCTLSIMIKCCCKRDDPAEAKLLLDYMLQLGFEPDIATFTVVINSFCKKGKLQKAFEVFEMMAGIGLMPNVQAYNCLMKGLCYVGRIEDAYELLMKLKKDYDTTDIYSYTIVMDGFCKVGRTSEAMELFDEALASGLKPNVVTFNAIFHGYCKEGRPLEGVNLLFSMKEKNCTPDYISYSTLLHGLLKWGEIGESLQVYKEMIQNGYSVDERMMNTLLRAICRRSWQDDEFLEEAYGLFDDMKRWHIAVYPCAYGLFIQTLCIGKEISKAVVHLHDMIRVGYLPRMVTFNSVIRALCVGGRVDDALLVLVVAYECGRLPSRISYNLLINEFNRQGRYFVGRNVYGAALKVGVLPDKKPFKDTKYVKKLSNSLSDLPIGVQAIVRCVATVRLAHLWGSQLKPRRGSPLKLMLLRRLGFTSVLLYHTYISMPGLRIVDFYHCGFLPNGEIAKALFFSKNPPYLLCINPGCGTVRRVQLKCLEILTCFFLVDAHQEGLANPRALPKLIKNDVLHGSLAPPGI